MEKDEGEEVFPSFFSLLSAFRFQVEIQFLALLKYRGREYVPNF